MKNIRNYKAEKYATDEYKEIEQDIYEVNVDGKITYVTSISYEIEEDLDEDEFEIECSQYPLEDILDKVYCHINDFYFGLKTEDNSTVREFASPCLEDVIAVRTIIGKRVLNRVVDGRVHLEFTDEE